MSEHENWVRFNSVDLAVKINRKNTSVDKIIHDVGKISGFILSKQAVLTNIKCVNNND